MHTFIVLTYFLNHSYFDTIVCHEISSCFNITSIEHSKTSTLVLVQIQYLHYFQVSMRVVQTGWTLTRRDTYQWPTGAAAISRCFLPVVVTPWPESSAHSPSQAMCTSSQGHTVYITEHKFHGMWKFNWRCRGALQYCETKQTFDSLVKAVSHVQIMVLAIVD